MTHAPAERAPRPPRPGWTPRQWPVGQPDPGPQRREPADNECFMCCTPLDARRLRTCRQRGDSPNCVECARSWRQSQAIQAANERAYRQAREKRAAAARRDEERRWEKARQSKVAAWIAERPGCSEAEYPYGGISRRGGV